MKNTINKSIAIFLMSIFLFGMIPTTLFAQPAPSPFGEVKGFNKSVFDSNFSKADREIDPDRWLAEAKLGISQAIYAWEIIAFDLYESPLSFEEAKTQIENWSSEELEARFSKWLMMRFFGEAAEKELGELSDMLAETQKKYSWHLDDEGNIIFNDKTGDPQIIRPGEEGREFSQDFLKWREEADAKVKARSESFENNILRLFPELLAYIPEEMRETMSSVIYQTGVSIINSIKREFENIAAREERIFSSRRTRDIWSLRKKSDDEAARIFTERLITETDEACARGIEELNQKIEEASAGTGDLALMGEEWLNLYKEQFDRGLKAWEEAEERFFVRRIEWEQDSYRLFSEGEETWLAAFNQFEEERQKWELKAKELFQAGEQLFKNISETFEKNIAEAKKEFEINMAMCIGAGTTKVKAMIDMYLICASAAITMSENLQYWTKQYGGNKNPRDTDYEKWFLDERSKIWKLAETNYLKNSAYTTQLKKLEQLKLLIEEEIENKDGKKTEEEIAQIKQKRMDDYLAYLATFNKNNELLFQIQDIINGKYTLSEEVSFAANKKNVLKSYARNFETFFDLSKTYDLYISYMEKAVDSRDMILADYAELIGTGALKDILADDASSDDFCLDEYQIALVRAKALVLYWERKKEIAQSVMTYAGEIDAGRMTHEEGLRAWEDAKALYNESLVEYEAELNKLNLYGENLKEQQIKLDELSLKMLEAEEKLSLISSDYSALNAASITNISKTALDDYDTRFKFLLDDYKLYYKTGTAAVYKTVLEYGMKWGVLDQKENAQKILDALIYGDGEENLSLEELTKKVTEEEETDINLRLRLAEIDLFADDYSGQLRAFNSTYSGMDWYFKAKDIKPSEENRTAFFGKNLYTQLIEDYENSCKVLAEKSLDPELNVEEFYNEYIFCLNLLDIYSNYAGISSFGLKENWQAACDSLKTLFAGYSLDPGNKILPDIQSISKAIFAKKGDFAKNSALFLIEFDECFQLIPAWLREEINIWKNSLVDYIAANALYMDIKLSKNAEQFALEQSEINAKYKNLDEYAASFENISDEMQKELNDAFVEIKNEEILLYYEYRVSSAWESLSKDEAASVNEKHWRQYIVKEVSDKYNSVIASASAWNQGVLADALDNAVFSTNRLNDAFLLYSKNEKINSSANAAQFYTLYMDESSRINRSFNSLTGQYYEIARLGKIYEISQLSTEKAKEQAAQKYIELKEQESVFNAIRDEYLLEAENFLNIGIMYDKQYVVLKKTHNNTEEKRFEYEKQDAIQRWASTAYLDTDVLDLDNCNKKLANAQMVLTVLSDLYNNESRRPYDNPQYNALFSEYEQSFSRKIKTLEALEYVMTELAKEKINNEAIFKSYQSSVNMLGSVEQSYTSYKYNIQPQSWARKDVVIVTEDGMLAFKKSESMVLSQINYIDINKLKSFFSDPVTPAGEQEKITKYEESLRTLSQRMSGYFIDTNKYRQWSLARDYLLHTLIEANPKVSFIKNSYIGLGAVGKDGSLANEGVKRNPFVKVENLYETKDLSLINYNQRESEEAWNNLSEQERADLEYYVILTLSGDDYYKGFSLVHTIDVYQDAYNHVNHLYEHAKDMANKWWIPTFWMYYEMWEINDKTKNEIESVLNETKKIEKEWETGLNNNLSSIQSLHQAYTISCKRIIDLEGKKQAGQNIVWDDLEKALSATKKLKTGDIAALKTYWEKKQEESSSSYKNVSDALTGLVLWAKNAETKSRQQLEERWLADEQKQKENENEYKLAEEAFIAGSIGIESLKNAAEKAYGKNAAAAWKNHFENMNNALIKDISLYMNSELNFSSEFGMIGADFTQLTAKTLERRYAAELAAREAEWNQMRQDVSDKYFEWLNTAAQIFENGRADWNTGIRRMEESYKKWNTNFQDEYNRVSDEWNEAYLAGLEDKEKWLEQAAAAFNQASVESLLLLTGGEGERLSRFVDTREPFGIRDAIPETESLMLELMQASGISNMFSAFSSLNNIASTAATVVKRGMGGVSAWDNALAKTAASDLARKTNAEIADREARKLAHNAGKYADEAIQSIYDSVAAANDNFRESMDNTFIMNGLWRRDGKNYIKNIIRGSTLFNPVIDETVTIEGYKNYVMEPVSLTTNMDENFLADQDSIVVRALVEHMLKEVEAISKDIFGKSKASTYVKSNVKNDDRKQSPGKFGAHIGYVPARKSANDIGNSNEFFYDKGAGELGRLMTDYFYWDIINSRGSAQLALAPWDRRMWNDDDIFFKAPTIRSTAQMIGGIAVAAVSVAGAAFTGGASLVFLASLALVSVADEVALGTLDLIGGYKKFDEVAFDVGKSYLTSFLTNSISFAFQGIEAATALGKAALNGTQTFASSITTTMFNGINYTHAGGVEYTHSDEGIRNVLIGTLSSMASTFTTGVLDNFSIGKWGGLFIGDNKAFTDINNFNNLAGSLVGQGVNLAFGEDFNLNLLSSSLFTGILKQTGLAESILGQGVSGDDFGSKISNYLSSGNFSTGLLELHIGRNGSTTMNFGTGGANISIDYLASAFRGIQAWNVNNRNYNDIKSEFLKVESVINTLYDFEDEQEESLLWDILSGIAEFAADGEGDSLAEAAIDAAIPNENGMEQAPSLQEGSISEALAQAVGNGMTKDQMDEILTNSGLENNDESGWHVRNENAGNESSAESLISKQGFLDWLLTNAKDIVKTGKDLTKTGYNTLVKFASLFQKKSNTPDSQFDTSNYVKFPDGFFTEISTDDIKYEYSKKNDEDHYKCNTFVIDMITKYFEPKILEAIFQGKVGNAREDANGMFLSFLKNTDNLERLDPAKIDGGLQAIQKMADDGMLILLSARNSKGPGHIAFIGTSDLEFSTNYSKAPDYDGQKLAQLERSEIHLVVVQAGAYPGITSIRWATNGWRDDEIRANLLKNDIYFYAIRRPQ